MNARRRQRATPFFLILVVVVLSTLRLGAGEGPPPARGGEVGAPVVTNYEPAQYGAHAQNWVAVQDRRGVMYFGNSMGVLEFDGRRWQLIPTPDNTIVRALACGPDGTIFYGAIGDIGYLAATPEGKVEAVSLREAIPPADRNFNDVWQALSGPQGVYFLSTNKIFLFANGKVQAVAGRFTTCQACLLDNQLFLVERDRGICLLQGGRIVPVPGLESLWQKKRIALAPFGPHQMLVASILGEMHRVDLTAFWDSPAKRYDLSRPAAEGAAVEFPCEAGPHFTEQNCFLYRLFPVDGNTFAICTLKGGLILIDRSGAVTRVINTQQGLLDNTVAGAFVDECGDLWAPNNSGISHIELSVPQSVFGPRNGINGTAISVRSHLGRLYVGTFQNGWVLAPYRYSGENDRQRFDAIRNSPNEIWQFLVVSGDLLAATGQGLYQIIGGEALRVPGSSGSAYCLGVSRRWPDHLFVGLMGALEVFRRSPEGAWLRVGRMAGTEDNIRSLAEDGNGDLWAATDAQGLLRFRLGGDSPIRAQVERYGIPDGLPALSALQLESHGNVLYVASAKGIYRGAIPPATPGAAGRVRFSADPVLFRPFAGKPVAVSSLTFDRQGALYCNTEQGILRVVPGKDGRSRIERAPFRGLPTTDAAVYPHPDGSVWVPGKELYRVDPLARKDYSQPFHTLIRKVTAGARIPVFEGAHGSPGAAFGGRTTLFTADQPPQDVPELPYLENAVTFEFSAAFYEKPDGTSFQYYLEGFDEGWSAWSKQGSKEYTNLPEGSYRFRVRARNSYGTTGREAAFRLRVLPPGTARPGPGSCGWSSAAGCSSGPSGCTPSNCAARS